MTKNNAYQSAQQKLQYYCSYQERSLAEVTAKLASYKLLTSLQQKTLIEELIKENFLNEQRYLATFISGKFTLKKWGKLKILKVLLHQKIARGIIEKALSAISEEDYQATIEKLIISKDAHTTALNTLHKKQKVINYLLQKGYEYQLALTHVDRYYQTHDLQYA